MTIARCTQPLIQKTSLFMEAIRFHESIFALPFAYTGMLLAAHGFPTWHQFLWITAAMISGRTIGMASNRIVDRHIDLLNPRTANRALPSGRLRVIDIQILLLVSVVVFFFSAARLNTLALSLAPIATAYIILYPYAKRFTWTANILLGWALAIAPSAAWIGVTGSLAWEPVLLSIAVASWAGSFDILYHIQDLEYHVNHGLNSVAQRFGIEASFRWAKILDSLAITCLIILGVWMALGWPYYVACIMATGLLIYKHRLASPDDTSHLGTIFFRINASMSTTIFLGTVLTTVF